MSPSPNAETVVLLFVLSAKTGDPVLAKTDHCPEPVTGTFPLRVAVGAQALGTAEAEAVIFVTVKLSELVHPLLSIVQVKVLIPAGKLEAVVEAALLSVKIIAGSLAVQYPVPLTGELAFKETEEVQVSISEPAFAVVGTLFVTVISLKTEQPPSP